MQSAPQDLMKEYVRSQKFTSTADIMGVMWIIVNKVDRKKRNYRK